MATQEAGPTAPKVFISYSWDDDAHKEWVLQLATRLTTDGVDVTLDRWDAAPGDQLPAFMERAVRENDFVIAVCTPRFKEKSDGRGGGVGYEGDILTAYAFTSGSAKKFIPILRRGAWVEVAPAWLLGRFWIDLSGDPYSESEYEKLLRAVHGAKEAPPPIGRRPDFGGKGASQASPSPVPTTSPSPHHQPSISHPRPQRDDRADPVQSHLAEPPGIPDGDAGPVEGDHAPDRSDGVGTGTRRGATAAGRSAVASGYAGRWIETNSELLTIAILALTIAVIVVAAGGLTVVGMVVVVVVLAAAGGWIAYRASVRRRQAGKLAETASRNVIDRPGFFRVRPYDDTQEDQQLFDRADGAHEEVLRWLRDSDRPILFLSGLSGTGKSSLLYAYVLPRLRGGPAPGLPGRDVVLASPAAGPAPSPPGVVVLRNYDDPMGQLAAALRKLDASGSGPAEPEGPREAIRRVAGRCCGRLLIVLDQYEQLLIAQEGNAQRFEGFVGLLRSLADDPIPGVTALITLRGDYLGFLDEQGLGTVTLNENLKIIQAFRPQDARAFLARSGLRIEPELLRRIVDELAEVERTEGLIRPITLNMLGLALSHRSPGEVATLPPVEEVLTDYCRACISRQAIRPYAPAVLRPMISRVETIQSRTVAALARRTRLRPAIIKGVLLNLGNDGLVRRVDASEDLWEVSHDFVAHLLAGLLRRFQALKVGLPLAAAALLLIGLTAWMLPDGGDILPPGDDVVVAVPDATSDAEATNAGASTGDGPQEISEEGNGWFSPVVSVASHVLGRDEEPRAAIRWLWENGSTLKICFLDANPEVQELVKQYAVEWTEHANLKFEFVNKSDFEAADIRITCPPSRVFQSFLGTDSGGMPKQFPSMTLGFTPDILENRREVRRLVLQQFGHALGLINEHQNPNCRDEMKWKSPEVFDYFKRTQGWDQQTIREQIVSAYDLQAYRACDTKSIMMFSFPADVMEPATSVNFELSESDKAFVRQLYPPDSSNAGPEADSVTGAFPLVIGEVYTGEIPFRGFEMPFRFSIEAAGLYVIETVTPEGATDQPWILSLFDEQMDFIAEDRQASGEGLNARIEQSLSEGTYNLRVHNRMRSNLGEFGVIVRPANPPADTGSRIAPFHDLIVRLLVEKREEIKAIDPQIGEMQLRDRLQFEAMRLIVETLDLPDLRGLDESERADAGKLVHEVLSDEARP